MQQTKLENTNEILRTALDAARNPILCCSFGKDSVLVLHLIRELGYNIPVLIFQDWLTKYQKVFIKEMVEKWKLTVFFYQPLRAEKRGDSLVTYYNVAGRSLPVIQDIVTNGRCGLDLLNFTPLPFNYIWDLTIVGSKNCDEHPLVSAPDFEAFNSDSHKMIMPLADWSHDEVWDYIIDNNVPYDARVYYDGDEKADTGNFSGCFSCVDTKEQVFCTKTQGMISGIGV